MYIYATIEKQTKKTMKNQSKINDLKSKEIMSSRLHALLVAIIIGALLFALASCSPPPANCKAKVKAIKASIRSNSFIKR